MAGAAAGLRHGCAPGVLPPQALTWPPEIVHSCDGGWAQCIPAPSNLGNSLTHTKLPVELICEQRVGQLSEVELAEGGHTMDVLQEGGARQFRDPLTVKLMPKATRSRSRRRKIWVRAGPPDCALPAPLTATLSVLGTSEAEPSWMCSNPVCQRQGCPILQGTPRLRREVLLPIATQG